MPLSSFVVSRGGLPWRHRSVLRASSAALNAPATIWNKSTTMTTPANPPSDLHSLKESYDRSFSRQKAKLRDPFGMIMTQGSINDNDDMVSINNPLRHQTEDQHQEWTLYENKIPVLHTAESSPQPETYNENSGVCDTPLRSDASSTDPKSQYGIAPRISLLIELTDRVGVLHDVLRWFWKYDVNIARIESRPVRIATPSGQRPTFDFFVDLEGSPSDANVAKLLSKLRLMTDKLLVLDEKEVHWFPRYISELDLIAGRTLDAGVDLIAEDHPGFNDPVYRERRAALTESALNHRWNQPIARIEYTPEEIGVWAAVWDRMEDLWKKYACREYLHALELMKQHCGYRRDNIPQQEDISQFLFRRTGFIMRPVAGLLSSRDFLNGLAFRCFFSTQYIRHSSRPLYTPEPDICHELLGHAPMLADRSFADFSQEIGLASLGASDDDIDRLAHCYWHSVEFGLCKEYEGGKPVNKAYGAGLLSSFGELEYACGDHTLHQTSSADPDADDGAKELEQAPPEIKPWEPEVAARQAFPITTYQPVYFLAESLEDAKQRMRRFCEDLPRPFFALHNAQTDTVHIDRPVVRTKGVPENAESGVD